MDPLIIPAMISANMVIRVITTTINVTFSFFSDLGIRLRVLQLFFMILKRPVYFLGHGNSGHSLDHHGHTHDHDHHHHDDHNLKAAYLHVLTDAMTSVLAIFALLVAKFYGYSWADPVVGILGSVVVAKWAIGLLKQTSSVLLDKGDYQEEIETIRTKIENGSTRIDDIHVWQISENERSLILKIDSYEDKNPKHYHDMVKKIGKYDHVTIEVVRKSA